MTHSCLAHLHSALPRHWFPGSLRRLFSAISHVNHLSTPSGGLMGPPVYFSMSSSMNR